MITSSKHTDENLLTQGNTNSEIDPQSSQLKAQVKLKKPIESKFKHEMNMVNLNKAYLDVRLNANSPNARNAQSNAGVHTRESSKVRETDQQKRDQKIVLKVRQNPLR